MKGVTKESVIREYTDYLTEQGYKDSSIIAYRSLLRKYIEEHDINTTQELRTQLQREPNKIKRFAPVYKWLQVQPPSRKRSKHKEYKKRKPNGYNPCTDPLITKFQKERNIKDSTMQGYYSSLGIYITHCGFQDCTEMIQEALTDEKNRVPIKESRISEHLRSYKRHLHDLPNVRTSNTLHTYFTKVETFYRHFQVTVPQRPPMKIKKEYHVDYYDLPDKEMIETAINQSTIEMQALLYFMSSSGTAKAETLGMTVQDFIKGLQEYTKHTNPEEVVKELRGRKDLVPVIGMTRRKTNVPYYTCCSSEATYYILEYMDTHNRYNPEDPLFEIRGQGLMKRFQSLNDDNGWGFVGPFRRFRAHMLRKFHASNLGCSFEVINTLEGRTNGTIHETYVMTRPEKLKKIYMEHMHNVMIHPENFEGPHCGSNTLTAVVQKEVRKVNPQLVQEGAQPTNMVPGAMPLVPDYNLVKDIARLELRIEQLEEQVRNIRRLMGGEDIRGV